MRCVICDNDILSPVASAHLPRFVQCTHCDGYVAAEKGDTDYPVEYFTEEQERSKMNVFSPLLDFFLWLRMRKMRRVLNRHKSDFKELQKSDLARILDYGCGDGKLVAYLRKRGFDVDGYDPSPSAVALAQRKGLPVFGAVPDKEYDVVMLWHCLEHSDSPLHDIVALKEHLAVRARLLIAVPNGDSLEARLFGESFFCYDWPFHRVHFTPRALAILLEKAGFRVLSIDHLNPEYTLSSLVQTFLNLFLPKNVLYSVVANRRRHERRAAPFPLLAASVMLPILFSPILFLVFLGALVWRRTAAFIMVAERTP